MLNSISNVHEEFFKFFRPTLDVNHRGDTISIPTFYARESNKDNTEIHEEDYPQCILFDQSPDFDIEWNDNFRLYLGGFSDLDSDGFYNKALQFREPLRFQFRYDVSVYLYDALQKWSVQQYFLSRYRKSGSFTFNKTAFRTNQHDVEVGDVVPYTMEISEAPRQDGIHELNFEFTLKAMLSITDPEEVELLRTLYVNSEKVIISNDRF